MAVAFAGGCRVFGLREGEPATRRGGLTVWRHVGRERGAAAISLSVLELEPGSSAAWRNGVCDEVLGILDGEGLVTVAGASHSLGPGSGVYVRPHGLVQIASTSGKPLAIASSRCPDPGPEVFFEDPTVSGGALPSRGARQRGDSTENGSRSLASLGMTGEQLGMTGKQLGMTAEQLGMTGEQLVATEAPFPSPVVHFEDQPTERAGDGRWFRVLVDAKSGCEPVTQFIGFIPPGRAPEHFHEYEEVVCILAGTGRFWSGDESAPIAAGSCVYLPRRQPHCLENTGSDTLQLCGLFYPAGSPAVRYRPGGNGE